jgi:VIT1/CCC1 family predicted Fe2+/Mn2+ transporter
MNARDSWEKEMDAVYIYRVIADVERAPERRAMFKKLAGDAEEQASIWARQMRVDGRPAPDTYVPSRRARTVAGLVRHFGAKPMRAVLAAMKVRGMSVFSSFLGGHPLPSSAAEIGKRHRGAGGANLRALVFGANDGLVSNAGLILGVAGATGGNGESRAIVISGIAGLLAGAFSMASGEYVSVRSQREMFEYQIAAERDELEEYPEAEAAELSVIYQARGLSKDDADHMAGSIIKNPGYALDALAREELGLDPAQLGSPWAAAISSFFSFALGAGVPLVPFLITRGYNALGGSVVLTSLALFGVGAAISLFTGHGAVRGGLRMLLIGAAAAAATFFIGHLLDVSIS